MKHTTLIPILFLFSGPLLAEEPACSPTYEVKYQSCALPNSPTTVQSMTSNWILVNQGARKISDALCDEYVATMASKNPQATNIKVAGIEDRDASFRGLGKRDVYCRFTMDAPVATKTEDEACGIIGVERQGCFENLSVEFAQNCLKTPTQTDTDLWKKTACMLDAYFQAPRIKGMNQETYSELEFQIEMLKKSLPRSKSPNDRLLSNYIGKRFKE